jgi:hypothetical protein
MAEESAPRAPAARKGRKRVKVLYPTDRFEVEGVPTITAEGVALSADELKKAQAAADSDPGIRLVVEDGEDTE